ncbi:MAG TPA: hypothetical protein VFK05_33045 [Polyangiaceae bacterium]|nr:hypothetical protein [Polyangiaceae bacterium]
MTPDDTHSSHSHGFEVPDTRHALERSASRPWRAVAGVALCLGLAGVVTGLILVRRQSASDEHLTSDALQREELRDGWRTLVAAAALDAQSRDEQKREAPTASSANSASPGAAPPSVVIVNVPAASAPAAPPNVTNINLPNGSTMTPNGVGTDNANLGSSYAPNQGYVPNQSYTPNQSVPGLNYTPIQGYLPMESTYPLPAGSGSGTSAQNGALAPSVGNGSIPGSTPNPALPNNGLVGSTPAPVAPPANAPAAGVTPSTPVGPAPASPGTPSLPSGFSSP